MAPSAQRALTEGNRTMRAALRLVGRLHAAGVPWLFEHPLNSFVLRTPEVQDILRDKFVQRIHLDQCAFGAPFRKPTVVLAGNCCPADLVRLDRRCGAGPTCLFSGRAHLKLEGGSRTRRAAKYPRNFAHGLAQVICAQAHAELFNSNGPMSGHIKVANCVDASLSPPARRF